MMDGPGWLSLWSVHGGGGGRDFSAGNWTGLAFGVTCEADMAICVSADGARWAALPEKTDERRNVELARERLPIWRGASCAEGPSAAAKGGRSNGTGIEGSSQVGKRALIRRVCAYAFGVL